jgi:cytochrome c peroxidase
MTRRLDFIVLVCVVSIAAGGCAAIGSAEEEGLDQAEYGSCSNSSDCEVIEGGILFALETFGGNGRTCATCHPSIFGTGTLTPAEVEKRFQYNPTGALFRHDGADVIGGNTFNRIRTHATILVDMPLPANVRIVGSEARDVILARGIPTTMNTPALDPVLMYDGRAPNLAEQARGAIAGHAQSTDVVQSELDAIAAFQQTLFNRSRLRNFVRYGTPITMPQGTTDAEKRGRRFFIADDQTDPDMVGENPAAKCGWCHSGDFLNGFSAFAVANIVPFPASEGGRFAPVLVSELNEIGNQRYDFEFTKPDGSVQVVNSPDPGLALITGNPAQSGFFKIPTVWGAKDTAPYFHDNSAKTLEQLMEHYDRALFILSSTNPRHPPVIDLTDQEKADIVAYLKRL